ncbi:MAG: hypothetical protein AAGI11_08255 [Pseudomonadota bacterium]
MKHPPGRMLSINTAKCAPSAYPVIHSIFYSPALTTLLGSFDPGALDVNHSIALTHETEEGSVTDLHFDTRRSIKVLMYLQDTDEHTAAFRYAPGSHIENTLYRERFFQQGGDILDLQNALPVSRQQSLALDTLDGPGGSLIIFDTDGWHMAGQLADRSRQRRVIRSRSPFITPSSLAASRFSIAWFKRKLRMTRTERPFTLPQRESTGGSSRKRS